MGGGLLGGMLIGDMISDVSASARSAPATSFFSVVFILTLRANMTPTWTAMTRVVVVTITEATWVVETLAVVTSKPEG